VGEDLMTIEYIASVTSTTTSTVLSTSSLPTTTQDGDFLVWIVQAWSATIASEPSGYGFLSSTGGSSSMHAYRRFVSGSSLPTVQFSAAGSHIAALHAFRGIDTNTPVDGASPNSVTATSTVHTLGSTTISRDGCMTLCSVATGVSTSGYSYTWDAPATKRVDMRSSAGYRYLSTATTEHPTAGQTGAATARFPVSLYNFQIRLVLNPKSTSRLYLGSTPVPLMLGNTEVEIMGP